MNRQTVLLKEVERALRTGVNQGESGVLMQLYAQQELRDIRGVRRWEFEDITLTQMVRGMTVRVWLDSDPDDHPGHKVGYPCPDQVLA